MSAAQECQRFGNVAVNLPGRALSAALNPRAAAAAAILVIAGAFAIVSWSRPQLSEAIGDAAAHGVAGFNTVAAMLSARSPRDRPAGELASLKPKRQAAPHERALAKVRPAAPASVANIVAPPPAAPAFVPPIASAPLYNVVAPPPLLPAETLIPGAPPVVFPAISPPGGGGVVVPPVQTPIVTPVTPLTPATPLPEPSSWAMMLIGLVLMGRIVGRGGAAASG